MAVGNLPLKMAMERGAVAISIALSFLQE